MKWAHRKRFTIDLDEFNAVGEVKLVFSEPLQSIDDYKNITLKQISNDLVFNIRYQTFV